MEAAFERAKTRHNWPEDFALKAEQVTVLNKLSAGRHVFAILPTGYGKSMLYIVPPIVGMGVALVISPLRALMEDQATMLLSQHNIKAAIIKTYKGMDSKIMRGIVNCEYSVLFSSPEAILEEEWLNVLRSNYRAKLGLVTIDEVHCVTEWGTDDFRTKFRELIVLRSLFPSTPFLLTTATMTEPQRLSTLSHLGFSPDIIDTVAVLPDRQNIHLHYHSRPAMQFEVELKQLVNCLKQAGRHADKTIIYCKTIKAVTDVFEFLVDELGNDAYEGGVRDPKTRIITMFHGSTDAMSMAHTLLEITKDDGVIRCVVATVAFGLGVSINNIRNVYVWGVPGTIQSLWQMIGRAARDGVEGDAYIYATKTSMSSKPKPDEEMKALIGLLNEKGCCIRQCILAQFQTTGMDISRLQQLQDRQECALKCLDCSCPRCVCCSLCRAQCKCRSAEAMLVNMTLQ